MVDLKNQYLKIKDEIDKAIFDVIASTRFVKGETVRLFEEELSSYLGAKHVIACGNGTDALMISLMALDLEPGAEVILPDFTFAATVEVVKLLGFKPVPVDVYDDDFNINVEEIEKNITDQTRVIMPVHLFGQAANMEKIMAIAKEHCLYVIEDNAQSLGTDYYFRDGSLRKLGTIGHIGTTSFFPSKNLGAFGDGGAVFTNDDMLAKKIRAIANHGMFTRYIHELIGVNSRLDSIQAAILRVKLKYLDQYNEKRRQAADYYDKLLKNTDTVQTPSRNGLSSHIFHQYTVKILSGRDKVVEHFKNNNIPFAIYYPLPMHRQKAYADKAFTDKRFPVSVKLSNEVLSLPMHTELTPEQQNFIVENLLEAIKK